MSDFDETKVVEFELTAAHREWLNRKRKRKCFQSVDLEDLLKKQRGLCALSGAPLLFDLRLGTPVEKSQGCHPLYAAVDHIDPGSDRGGYQIVCYDLNDLKGHLPLDCFLDLCATPSWISLMAKWRSQAEANSQDREAFKKILRPKPEKEQGRI